MIGFQVRTAYEILCVAHDADVDQIRKAYRLLAKRLHPDHAGNSPEAENSFLELKAAYDILRDPQRRLMYDHDPGAVLEDEIYAQKRRAHIKRRRKRLMRLYD